MDSEIYRRLSLRYKILEQIGYDQYQIKIWIMSHMDIQDKIDIEGFGKFSCKSFMKKGKSYNYLIAQVKDLVNRKVLLIVDRHHPFKYIDFQERLNMNFKNYYLQLQNNFVIEGHPNLQTCLEDVLKKKMKPVS